MIDAEILTITAELLKSEEAEVREQSALLLGSFALSAIARQFFYYAFPNMKALLEDEESGPVPSAEAVRNEVRPIQVG